MTGLCGEFFAVTRTSLYKIHRCTATDLVSVTKLAIRTGADSPCKVGIKLSRAKYLAITWKYGIFFYYFSKVPDSILLGHESDARLLAEDVDRVFWRPGTSKLVGLFLRRPEANECLAACSMNIRDIRWKPCTKEVLRVLKDDPIMRVSHPDSEIGFPADFFE